jgi:gamma-glutamyltranspeptidase/glutathione hydrolase
MVATELALAVAYTKPWWWWFMVYRKQMEGTLDYREKAPLAATKDMFLDAKGNVIPGKSKSPLAIGFQER